MHTRDISPYQPSHVFHYTGAAAEKQALRVVLLTFAMMVVEIVAGWLFHPMALFADGWHLSTHAAALGISWVAFVLARRHIADRRKVPAVELARSNQGHRGRDHDHLHRGPRGHESPLR